MSKTKLLSYLPGIMFLCLFYFAYTQVYQHTSWTLAFPALATGFCAWGLYQYRIFRRRCIAQCFLQQGTWPYMIMQGWFFSLLSSLIISVVYAASLMSFIALGSWTGLTYVLGNLVLVALLYSILYPVLTRWVTDSISENISRKLVAWAAFIIMLPLYLWVSFNTAIPEYVDPDSLAKTISNASYQVGALCPVTNFVLKASHEIDAMFFYYSAASSLKLEQNWLNFLIWVVFFLKSSLVFLAMSRFNIEVVSRIANYYLDYMDQAKIKASASE